ncbi:hypothetical protein ADU76_10310 (plasmid) [Clostridium botulinum]|uniref:hypothetical protein n=1 Tax=Clostridium botulinum TaxID=1491 RepID=UPI00069C1D5A|nr:hypothetical protein [Clostridium botulinum]KOA91830.1 hypothetical protein ADU76_10310 [Clostridium botulinum]
MEAIYPIKKHKNNPSNNVNNSVTPLQSNIYLMKMSNFQSRLYSSIIDAFARLENTFNIDLSYKWFNLKNNMRSSVDLKFYRPLFNLQSKINLCNKNLLELEVKPIKNSQALQSYMNQLNDITSKISAIDVPSSLNTFVCSENVLPSSINDFCNYVEDNLSKFDGDVIYKSQADLSNLSEIKSINFKYWLVLVVSVISMIILYSSKVIPSKTSDMDRQYYILVDNLLNNINRCLKYISIKTSTLNK